MQPLTRTATVAALALIVSVGAPFGYGLEFGNGSAAAQWLVSPPLDTPPTPQRPPESYRRQVPQATPGEPNVVPSEGQDGDGSAAAPPAGCPYNEGALELLV